MKPETTDILEVISQFIVDGYDREYSLEDGQLLDLASDVLLETDEIRIDRALRLESVAGAGDATNIYAISDLRALRKGLLIDAFDVLDGIVAPDLYSRLTQHRRTVAIHDDAAAIRYGLHKVYKGEFDREPGRYVLHIDFPDFPRCPFGKSYSVLGFDTARQRYVWLVSSIMRDARLTRIFCVGTAAPDHE